MVACEFPLSESTTKTISSIISPLSAVKDFVENLNLNNLNVNLEHEVIQNDHQLSVVSFIFKYYDKTRISFGMRMA